MLSEKMGEGKEKSPPAPPLLYFQYVNRAFSLLPSPLFPLGAARHPSKGGGVRGALKWADRA